MRIGRGVSERRTLARSHRRTVGRTRNQMEFESRMLIDGELVDAEGRRTYDNVNPATEAVIGPVADATPADMERAIGAARRAFDETTWATDRAFRKSCLQQLKDSLEKHKE